MYRELFELIMQSFSNKTNCNPFIAFIVDMEYVSQ